MKRLVCCLIGLIALNLMTGCATARGESAYNAYMQKHVTQHVYQKQCVQLEPMLRDRLFRDGYSVKSSDGVNIETEWRVIPESSYRRRYLIQLIGTDAPTCQLVAQYSDRHIDNRNNPNDIITRDWELEFDVMESQDPGAAAVIEQGARQQRECAIQEIKC